MFLEKLENFNKMFKKENDLKLIFKDKKNDKYGLILPKNEILTEKLLKNLFKVQFGFDDEILELYSNGKKIVEETYDNLSKQNLIILNIQHERIIKSKIKKKKINDFDKKNINFSSINEEINKSETFSDFDFDDNKNKDDDNFNIDNNIKNKNFSILNDISIINTDKKNNMNDYSDNDNSFFIHELEFK